MGGEGLNKTRRAICAAAAAASLIGCAAGNPPFLLLDICLKNAAGVEDFRDELVAIAGAEGMSVGDRSIDSARELEMLNERHLSRTDRAIPLISIRLWRNDVSLGAGNLGLAEYQMAIGFQDGSSTSRAFADRVAARLEQRWTVKRIDGEKYGVMPDPDCQ